MFEKGLFFFFVYSDFSDACACILQGQLTFLCAEFLFKISVRVTVYFTKSNYINFPGLICRQKVITLLPTASSAAQHVGSSVFNTRAFQAAE